MTLQPEHYIAGGTLLISASGLIATLCIAIRQHRAIRDEQKLKLYDRRMQIYFHACEYVSEIVRNGNIESDKSIQMLRATRECVFLFNEDIPKYLSHLYMSGVDLNTLTSKLDSHLPVGETRTKIAEEKGELLKHFGDQILELPQRFKKYLNLGSIS